MNPKLANNAEKKHFAFISHNLHSILRAQFSLFSVDYFKNSIIFNYCFANEISFIRQRARESFSVFFFFDKVISSKQIFPRVIKRSQKVHISKSTGMWEAPFNKNNRNPSSEIWANKCFSNQFSLSPLRGERAREITNVHTRKIWRQSDAIKEFYFLNGSSYPTFIHRKPQIERIWFIFRGRYWM